MVFGIDEMDLKRIVDIIKRNSNVSAAVLFGSRAKGTHELGSDIDIAIKGKKIRLNDIIELKISFDELSLPYKFDLVIYDRISDPALLEHVNRVGVDLYKK